MEEREYRARIRGAFKESVSYQWILLRVRLRRLLRSIRMAIYGK